MKDNWIVNEIASVTSLLKDGTHGTHIDVSEGIPLLSAKDIFNGNISILEDARKISQEDYNSIHSNYIPEVGDVLLTLVGTIGRTAIIKNYSQKFTFQRSVGILRFTKEVYNEYAYHYINSEIFKLELDRATNASAQGGVYLGSLGKIKITYPQSLQKQQKIAKILSTCDEVIEKTEAAIAKYKAIKQGMMHDLFTRGIDTTTGKLRPSYQEAPELELTIRKEKINWIEKEIGLITNLLKDGTHGTHLDVLKGVPLLSAKDIAHGKIDIPDDARKISQKDYDIIHSRYEPEVGDILLTLVGTIGRTAMIKDFSQKFTFQRSVGILRFSKEIHNEYAYHYISSDIFKLELAKSTNASAQGGVYLGSLGKIKISYPECLEEQKRIAKIFNTLDTKLQAEESALQKYKKIKEGLMQDLLTGRVEVSE